MINKKIYNQGRIVHKSGLNNENNENKNKNSLKSKIKDLIFNSTNTMVKAKDYTVNNNLW